MNNTVIEIPKKKRGRPLGSKNKPKIVTPQAPVVTNEQKQSALAELVKTTGAKYSTLDEKVYEQALDQMNLNELHAEATRVGLKPLNDREITKRTLMSLFYEHRAAFIPNPGSTEKSKFNSDSVNTLINLMK